MNIESKLKNGHRESKKVREINMKEKNIEIKLKA